MNVLIVPHQDDELFILPEISSRISLGENFKVIYLTNGQYKHHLPEIRASESIKVLKSLGINSKDVYFIGHDLGVKDATVYRNLKVLYSSLKETLGGFQRDIVRIYVPAYEGGHHDHDATNFLVRTWLMSSRSNAELFQYYLYNDYGCKYLPYKINNPVEAVSYCCNFSLAQGLKTLVATFCYRSQWLTFLGLMPYIIYNYIFLRRLLFTVVDKTNQKCIDYNFLPFYEKRGRCIANEYCDELKKFENDID